MKSLKQLRGESGVQRATLRWGIICIVSALIGRVAFPWFKADTLLYWQASIILGALGIFLLSIGTWNSPPLRKFGERGQSIFFIVLAIGFAIFLYNFSPANIKIIEYRDDLFCGQRSEVRLSWINIPTNEGYKLVVRYEKQESAVWIKLAERDNFREHESNKKIEINVPPDVKPPVYNGTLVAEFRHDVNQDIIADDATPSIVDINLPITTYTIEPRQQSQLATSKLAVQGFASGDLGDSSLWVVVYAPEKERFYPLEGPVELTPSGLWSVTGELGNEVPSSLGDEFSILNIWADPSETDLLIDYISSSAEEVGEWRGFSQLPEGIEILDRVEPVIPPEAIPPIIP